MVHKVKDLSPEQRGAIEGLLGKRISGQDEVSVRVLSPGPSPESRREILSGLETHFTEIDQQRRPVTPEEAEEILNEALRSTRPNYRPVR